MSKNIEITFKKMDLMEKNKYRGNGIYRDVFLKLSVALKDNTKREKILQLLDLKRKLREASMEQIVKIDNETNKEYTDLVKSISIATVGISSQFMEKMIDDEIIELIEIKEKKEGLNERTKN